MRFMRSSWPWALRSRSLVGVHEGAELQILGVSDVLASRAVTTLAADPEKILALFSIHKPRLILETDHVTDDALASYCRFEAAWPSPVTRKRASGPISPRFCTHPDALPALGRPDIFGAPGNPAGSSASAAVLRQTNWPFFIRVRVFLHQRDHRVELSSQLASRTRSNGHQLVAQLPRLSRLGRAVRADHADVAALWPTLTMMELPTCFSTPAGFRRVLA